MNWAVKLAGWMQLRDLHLKRPRLHTLLLWVLSPRSWGEHLGLRAWLRYARR
jgi:hypothetical protein